jgi:hypothetical protein
VNKRRGKRKEEMGEGTESENQEEDEGRLVLCVFFYF